LHPICIITPTKPYLKIVQQKHVFSRGRQRHFQRAMSTAVYAVHAAQWAARQGASAPRREFFSQLR
jgi:hypothetical protein